MREAGREDGRDGKGEVTGEKESSLLEQKYTREIDNRFRTHKRLLPCWDKFQDLFLKTTALISYILNSCYIDFLKYFLYFLLRKLRK